MALLLRLRGCLDLGLDIVVEAAAVRSAARVLPHLEPRRAVGLGLLHLVLRLRSNIGLAGALLARLLVLLLTLLANFLAVALRIVVLPSPVILRECWRGRGAREKNG